MSVLFPLSKGRKDAPDGRFTNTIFTILIQNVLQWRSYSCNQQTSVWHKRLFPFGPIYLNTTPSTIQFEATPEAYFSKYQSKPRLTFHSTFATIFSSLTKHKLFHFSSWSLYMHWKDSKNSKTGYPWDVKIWLRYYVASFKIFTSKSCSIRL